MTYDEIKKLYYNTLTREYIDRVNNINETERGEIEFYDQFGKLYGTGFDAFANSGWGAACDQLAEVAMDKKWSRAEVEANIREDIESWLEQEAEHD